MKITLMILFLALFIFAIIYPSEIYPSRVKKRIIAQYGEIDLSNYDEHTFKVRAGAYFDYIFDLLLVGSLFLLGLFCLFVPGTGKNAIFVIMSVFDTILFGALTVFVLVHVIYFFPRRRVIYRNGIIYYREGNKERVIDKISGISYNRNSKSNYFTLNIRVPGEEKALKFDFMSFRNPEIVYKIMLSKLSGEAKREVVLKRINRR